MLDMTLEQGQQVFLKALAGNNFSAESIRAYNADITQFVDFLKSGIRESELAELTLEDVDFTHDELTVREGKGKKERTIPLMPELKRALGRYVAERERQANILDEETLFLARNGTSLNPSSIRKLVKKYYIKAGVRKSGVHTLRHTFSAHNVNNGMSIADLQKVLGHKKKETTLKYIHVVTTSLRETMLKTQA
jgi:site-specific recombinase XerD